MAESRPILDEIEAFLAHPRVQKAKITAAGFGKAAMSDSKFVFDLRSGKRKRVWPETADKVRAHILAEMKELGIETLDPPQQSAAA